MTSQLYEEPLHFAFLANGAAYHLQGIMNLSHVKNERNMMKLKSSDVSGTANEEYPEYGKFS